MYTETIETEAVFTMIEMNNQWIVSFIKNTKYVQNVYREKLHLTRQKWTMTERLVLFQEQSILKTSRLKLYLPKWKWRINEILILFKKVLLAFYTLIPVSFPLIKAPLKTLFWYDMKLRFWFGLFFGLLLWWINHCKLLMPNPFLYI